MVGHSTVESTSQRYITNTFYFRFYVNIYSKKSQWERPTQPVFPADRDSPPPGAPPGYMGGNNPYSNVSDKKINPYDDHRSSGSSSPNNIEEDARLAARLQAEENARAHTRGNAMQDYANTPLPPMSSPAQLPPREEKRGLFSKLLGKSHSQPQHGHGGYPQHGYPEHGYLEHGHHEHGHHGHGHAEHGHGAYPQHGYGGYPPQGVYGGYPPQGYGGYGGYAHEPPRRTGGGGLGMAGGAALGLGAGVLGGVLLEEAIQNNDQNEYDQGYGTNIPISTFDLTTDE
jgi:hypothetical protein